MAKYITHTITVHHKDGTARQHHVMASDDASAIHQVPIDPEHERIVGIRRSEHANVETPKITHAVSFKTNDLFGGDGHISTHYVSVKRGTVEKEIEKMTKKNPQLGTPLGAHKIAEGTRIPYSELKSLLSERGDFWHPDPEKDAQYDRTNRGRGASLEKHPHITPSHQTPAAPARPDRFSTMRHGTATPVSHGTIEDAHLHAHLNAMKSKTPHAVIHNGVKVATHSFVDGQHHVDIH